MNYTNDTQVRGVASSERIVARASIHEDVAEYLSRCVTSNVCRSAAATARERVANIR